MPKNPDQKLKILYVKEALETLSDPDHPLSAQEIIQYLDQHGIKAERKSIYDDVACLIRMGLDIEKQGGKDGGYFLKSRTFTVEELKTINTAIQSSRFLSTKQSQHLVAKVTNLAPKYQQAGLKQRVHVMSRLAHARPDVYSEIDQISQALRQHKCVQFQYTAWTIRREKGRVVYSSELKHEGKLYDVYPLEVVWDDENYYLVAWDFTSRDTRHYRLDHMRNLAIGDENNEGKAIAARFDAAKYSQSVFDMYNGSERYVQLGFHSSVIGPMLDRFGEDMIVQNAQEENWFRTVQSIRISDRFFGWVLAYGGKVKILGPPDVVKSLEEFLKCFVTAYHLDLSKEEEQ